MGLHVAERRLRKAGLWTLIVAVGLIVIPEILANIWLKVQSFASDRFQFAPGRFQTIALAVAVLGVGGWILLGLLKEE